MNSLDEILDYLQLGPDDVHLQEQWNVNDKLVEEEQRDNLLRQMIKDKVAELYNL